MSSSIRQIIEVPGGRFRGGVEHAGDVAAQPEEKLKLPDGTFAFLAALPRAKDPADQEELKVLLGERFELNERTLRHVERRLAEWREDLEKKHEEAKAAVREQSAVIEKLAAKLYEDTQVWISADNARRQAESAVGVAEREFQSLSRFAPKKEISEAERRIELATIKCKAAEKNAGEWGAHLNVLKAITVPAEQKKLAALMEAELELAAQLEGRDPHMAKFGILQR